MEWADAFEIVRKCTCYTNHTLLREALETWNIDLVRNILPRNMEIIDEINRQFVDGLYHEGYKREFVDQVAIIKDNYVHMANLLAHVSYSVNGVAKIHSDLLKTTVMKEFEELYPEKFKNVTNGFDEDELNLYAKMEKLMEEYEISIVGAINNSVVVNPAFTWHNANNSSYVVTLLSGTSVIAEEETTKTYYQVSEKLSLGTNYTFKVLDKGSNKEKSIDFKTMDTSDSSVTSITLLNPYSDGCVIQRDTTNTISGKGPANQVITVKVGNDDYFGVSNDKGNFEVEIPEYEASFTSVDITITNNIGISKQIKDVLFGDVYLFSGQSNMQWPTSSSDYKKADLDNLSRVNVRFFCQDVTTATTKQDSVKNGRWFKPDSNNVSAFSAIATMAGSLLGAELMSTTPIGIVTAYQGDTNIANWMGPEYYQGSCSTKYLHYNAMVYPLRGTKLSGVVWYQGCNNSAAGCEYKDLLLKLFENYRDLFNKEDLPFFVIGLACYDGDNGNNFDFSYVRESQAKACAEDDHAYFISTCDNGDPTYIHPTAKRYICERISKSICSVVYNRNYYAEGPSYKSHTVVGNKVFVEFNNAEGLKSVGKITGFLLAGSDGKYHEATAIVEDGKIVASSDKVDNPVYIKYGFGKSPFVSVFNKDNFAITPFRTDEYNTNIDLLDYDSIDNYTFHPDGSKMEISLVNNALRIKKTSDGKGYGSVRLNKWGAIAYNPQGFRLTINGTNSGASIAFRAVEGDSYEIWGYKVVDNFTGSQTFEVSVGDFVVMYNKQNNVFEPQKISYIEIMVEASGEATFDICEARFIEVERSKPAAFTIATVSEGDDNVTITLSKALFANSYELFVIKDPATSSSQSSYVYNLSQEDTTFVIDKSKLEKGIPYYVNAKAKNELGETDASNNGYVFYLKDDGKVVICNFDFKDQNALTSYIDTSMSVHAGLTCTLDPKGVKIVSGGQGWQQFIFKLDTGVGAGMTKMEFYADFSNYKGEVIIQLADTGYNTYNYTVNLQEKNEGVYTLNFNEFLKGSTPFTTQTLMWVMFNFNDNTGNGYILFDDLSLSK